MRLVPLTLIFGLLLASATIVTNNFEFTVCPIGHKCTGTTATPCTGNQYQPNSGQSTCLTCATGSVVLPYMIDVVGNPYYFNVGCIPCMAGTYWTQTTSGSTCTPCTGNTYSNTGATMCSECPVGKVASPYHTQCVSTTTSCPTTCITGNGGACFCKDTNMYFDMGTNQCQTCPAGYACNGSSYLSICQPGSYSTDGQTTCTKCPVGTMAPSYGASACTPCGSPAYQPETGRTMCRYCPSGYYVVNNQCMICNIGNYCPGDGKQYPCPAGTAQSTTGASICAPANPGYYSNTTGLVTCNPCTGNTIAQFSASTSCTECGEGYIANDNHTLCLLTMSPCGSSASWVGGKCVCNNTTKLYNPTTKTCDACPAGNSCNGTSTATPCGLGKYAPLGAGVCTPCPVGTSNGTSTTASACTPCTCNQYQPLTGQTTCLTCGPGSYVKDNQCKTCEAGYYCTGDGTEKPCAAGSYSGTGAIACTLCTGNKYQPLTGQTSCMTCAAGYYTGPPSGGNTTCTMCPAGYYCPGDGNKQPCAAGSYSGPCASSCTLCNPGYYSSTPASTVCPQCTGNTIAPGPGATSCMACPPYYIANSAHTSCVVDPTACGPNATYNPTLYQCVCNNTALKYVPESKICVVCPAGYSCNGTSTKTPCTPGTYAPLGAAVCTPCAAGTASNLTTAAFCPPCTGNTYQPLTGQTSCLTCGPGYYVNPTNTTCTLCTAGSYCPGDGSISCCPAANFSLAGATACSPCLPNQYQPATCQPSCIVCPPGSYVPAGSTQCLTCPAGYKCPGDGGSTICPPGTAAPAGSTVCTPCVAGTYAPASGQEQCNLCPDNSISTAPGATTCTPCPTGQIANENHTECVIDPTFCGPAATYNDTLAKCICNDTTLQYNTATKTCNQCPAGSSCDGTEIAIPCPVGTYGINGVCKPCPAGTASNVVGATFCPACTGNTYQPNEGQTTCLPCAAGSYVSDAHTTCNICYPGYYCPGDGSSHECPPGTFSIAGSTVCTPCTGSGYQPDAGQDKCLICPPGFYVTDEATDCDVCHEGSACPGNGTINVCSPGYYSLAQATVCTPCAAGTYISTPGASLCLPCASDSISGPAATECTECPQYYVPNADQTACIIDLSLCGNDAIIDTTTGICHCYNTAQYYDPNTQTCNQCPAGQSCDGSPAPTPCPVGYYAALGSGVCTICPVGTYSNTTGSAACTPCTGANYQPLPGQQLCLVCAQGGYVNSNKCYPCTIGHYCPGDGTTNECPVGYFQPSMGQAQCIQCIPPTYQPNTGASSCLSCVSGNFLVGQTCQPCNAGSYCPGNGNENTCPAGEYSLAGAVECTECEAGSYAPEPEATMCEDCQPDSVSGEGAAACTDCPPDTQANPDQTECVPIIPDCGEDATFDGTKCVCDDGTKYYNDQSCLPCPDGFSCDGSFVVVPCTPGHYSSNGSCLPCPAGTYQPGYGSKSCIGCPSNQIQPNTGSTFCTDCPEDTTSDSSGTVCVPIECPAGTFRSPSLGECRCVDSTTVLIDGVCQPCTAGFFCNGSGTTLPCPAGQVSPAGTGPCYECPEGYVPNADRSACVIYCEDGEFDPTHVTCVPDRCPPETTLVNGECICNNTALWLPGCPTCGCRVCPCGFLCNGTSEMSLCAAGSYSHFGDTSCTLCPAGTNVAADRCSCKCPPCSEKPSPPGCGCL